MSSSYEQFLDDMHEMADLAGALAVLGWDEQTYMPPGGTEARKHQKATLERLLHEKLTSPAWAERLAKLEEEAQSWPPESVEAAMLKVARRAHDHAAKLPKRLVIELSHAASEGYSAWLEARRENDFVRFSPKLERLIALQREKADALGWQECRYDALLDLYEPEMKTAVVRDLFSRLRDPLVSLVAAIRERLDRVDASILTRTFSESSQWEFSLEVLERIGFDFSRGRQDRSEHPFTTSFSPDDVRITTRVHERFFPSCLFGTIHEAGHALYEQGIPREFHRTFLASAASLGVHESQSRLWENVVGRSRAFWSYFFPRLRARFPESLRDVHLEDFYRAINRVEPSFIRVEADEVTYHLHIFLRFELEQELLEGRLHAADLPEAWNEKMRAYFGLEPPTPLEGVLQDIHWSTGMFGYFPTYTLGTLLSVQFYECALKAHPEIPDEISRGRFDTLRSWLNAHVHCHGARYTPQELIAKVTGGGLDVKPYLRYVKEKYGEIYGI